MSLRVKILIVTCTTLVGLVLVVYFVSRAILLNSYSKLEDRETRADVQRLLAALSDDVAQVNSIAGDWAPWDDTYAFVQGENPNYPKSNLTDDTFGNLRLNLLVFIDSSGRIVYGKAFDFQSQSEIAIPSALSDQLASGPDNLLLHHANEQSSLAGIFMAGSDPPILLASRPILKSGGAGPIRGTLIAGRFLDDAEIIQLEKLTHLPISLKRYSDTDLPVSVKTPILIRPLNDQTIAGYALINDIFSQPALVLSFETTRDIYQYGRTSLAFLMLSLSIVGVIFVAMTLLLWDRLALIRLARLSAGVSAIGLKSDLTARVQVVGRDELANVASEINRMLAALQLSEKAVRESEGRYKTISELTTDYAYALRVDDGSTLVQEWITDAFERDFGYAESELVRGGLFSIVHPEDRPLTIEHSQAILAGKSSQVELRLLTKSGDERIVQAFSRPVLDEDNGSVVRIIGAAQDITERKQAELALRESEERFRRLAENAPDVITRIETKPRLHFSYVSPAIQALSGYSPEDFYRDLNLGLRIIYAGDKSFIESMLHDDALPTAPVTFRWTSKTGRALWIELRNMPILDEDGHLIAVESIGRDVTERFEAEASLRESEERFRRQAAELNILYETSLRLNMQIEIPELRRVIVEQAIELLHARAGRLYMYDPAENELVASVALGFQGELPDLKPRPGEGLVGQVFQNRQPMVVAADQAEWELVNELERNGLTVLGIPFSGTHSTLGVLTIAGSERPFAEHDIQLAEMFAAQAAVALERTQLHVQAQRRARELTALNKAIQAILSTLDLQTALQSVIREVRNVLEAEGASALLHDAVSHELVFAIADGPHTERLTNLHMSDTSGIAGWVVQRKEPVLIHDVYTDPRFYSQIDQTTRLTTRSLIAAPMLDKESVVGVIEVVNKTDGLFDQNDLNMLEAMANSAAIAAKNARLYQQEKEQRELAETLREIGSTLVSTVNQDAVLDRLLEQVSRIVPNDQSTLMLIDGDLARAVHGRADAHCPPEAVLADVTYPVASTPYLSWMAQTGEPVVIPDTHADTAWTSDPDRVWLRSFAGAPIRVRGNVIGFLTVNSATPNFYRQLHAQQLRAFADQAAIALENARLFDEEHKAADRLQALSRRLVGIQEAERSRVARELHDEAGQALTSLMVTLRLLEQDAQHPDIVVSRVAELKQMASDVLEELHRLAVDLRPASLDHAGLIAAMDQFIQTFSRQHNLEIQFEVVGLEGQRLSKEIETTLYRIVQEALSNVARHARANRAGVILERRGDRVIVIVEDDGVGFDPEAVASSDRLGLLGIRERVEMLDGTLVIESKEGAGTTIIVEVPNAYSHSDR